MKQFFTFIFISSFSFSLFSQSNATDFKRLRFGEFKEIATGIALSPADSNIIISGIKNCPLYIFDYKKEQSIKEIPSPENWYAGSTITVSSSGNYLIMEQLFYNDFRVNQDKEVDFNIINLPNSKSVLSLSGYNAVKILQDEIHAVTLKNNEACIINIETGNKEKCFPFPGTGYAVAVSPDNKLLAISYMPTKAELKNNPAYKKNKKARKTISKYKNFVAIYDIQTMKLVQTIAEVYDIVYDLSFSDNGQYLFVLQIPHMKVSTGVDRRQTFINLVQTNNWEPQRKAFVSRANYQPDYMLTSDNQYFGLMSFGNKFPELHIYNFETGKMVYRFELNHRFFESSEGGLIATDGRAAFTFLPDNKSAIITMGNRIVLWNFEK